MEKKTVRVGTTGAALALAKTALTSEVENVFEFQNDSFDGLLPGVSMGRLRSRPKAKPLTVCLLPGCENKTSHNGGYCCAAHCRQHKEMRGIR